MDDSKPVELKIELSTSDASAESTDHMKRELLSELKKLYTESVKFVKGKRAQKSATNDPQAMGSIKLVVLPTVLPSLVGMIQEWASRGRGRTIKFKGKEIEFEGSPEELLKILAKHEKKRSRLAGDSTTDAPPPKKD